MNGNGSQRGRGGPQLAAGVCTIALALLWILRPPLPQITAPTRPMSAATAEQLLGFIAWALLALAIVRLIHTALRAAAERPSGRRLIDVGRIERALTPSPRRHRAATPAPRRLAAHPLTMTVPTRSDPPSDPSAASDQAVSVAGHTERPAADESPATASISLLGPIQVQGANPQRRRLRSSAQELLTYLALHPEGGSTDELLEALWPREDPKRTRQRLWQAAADARKVLRTAFVRDNDRYRLERTKLTIDIDQLHTLIQQAEQATDPRARRDLLEQALRLFRDQPLAGCDYTWAEPHLRQLRATQLALLQQVARARLTGGDPRTALQAAEQGIAIDQLDESLWRTAMQAEAALGLREAITQRYERLKTILDEQLGLEPHSDTRTIYRQLLGSPRPERNRPG